MLSFVFVFCALLTAVISAGIAFGSLILTMIAFHAGIFTGICTLFGCLTVMALFITFIGSMDRRYHLI